LTVETPPAARLRRHPESRLDTRWRRPGSCAAMRCDFGRCDGRQRAQVQMRPTVAAGAVRAQTGAILYGDAFNCSVLWRLGRIRVVAQQRPAAGPRTFTSTLPRSTHGPRRVDSHQRARPMAAPLASLCERVTQAQSTLSRVRRPSRAWSRCPLRCSRLEGEPCMSAVRRSSPRHGDA
jgi:hypothetical protein